MRIIDYFVQTDAKEKGKEVSKMKEISAFINRIEVSGEKNRVISLL